MSAIRESGWKSGVALCALMVAGCGSDMPGPQSGLIALTGATVIDGTGGPAFENGVILVRGDELACVGTAADCPVPEGTPRTDLTGQFITPGLVDAHVHFDQTGWLDGRPEALATDVYPYEETIQYLWDDPGRWHRAFLCSGITAVYDVGGAVWTVTDEQATDTDRPDRAHVRAAGPLITHVDYNAPFMTGMLADQPVFLPMQSETDIVEDIAFLQSIGSQAVKVWYLQPDPADVERLDALLMAAGAAADAAGLPLLVHATDLREAKVALRAGADMLVHSVGDQPVDREFLDLLAANETFYAPTLIVPGNWSEAVIAASEQSVPVIDDPNGCVDAALRDRIDNIAAYSDFAGQLSPEDVAARRAAYQAEMDVMQANLIAVYEAGGRIVTSTDSGNPLTLHGAAINPEMEAMQAAGLPASAIIEMSTRTGAEAMGLSDRIGTLEAGKLADLIVLDADPREDIANMRRLSHVMRAGFLLEQSDLQLYTAPVE
ncbi:amidohydrolase family protein [Maricaulis parjimensis]|uniref:amidohydrolase family protein n=1 Tax=Maricaulis parjimensis TaxID=144023 RepID=UPI00193943DA|nr:amidohydrolase family protein [Maricaulis parjimensis]